MVAFCELDIEPLGSIKGGEFLEQLRDYWILKKRGLCYGVCLVR